MKQLLYILMLFATFSVFAQDKTGEDIKVGLVLSGGGAKGLAHIGAIKVIEDASVRIDYIGGTSMGAIVGALYASGYNAKQLDSIFANIDFNTLIQDDIPRSAKTFYEKDDADRYAITLPFDKLQVKLPSGISKGQNVYNLLSRLLSHVSEIEDFSKLPIPFFCMATNVENGNQVVLDNGYLPRAITASGALPSLFSPVIIDDKVLIDGGVVNNYPVDEVKARGADIIIGVDVQDSLRGRENLKSALEVLVQINNYRTINDMIKKRENTDIYIQPKIEDFTVVAFNEGKKIVEAGAVAATSNLNALTELARRQKTTRPKEVNFENRTTLYVDQIDIEGNENYSRAYILGKLKLQVPDEISYDKFSEGINNLSATGNFQDISYRLYESETGKNTILLQLRESDSRTLLRFSAHYDDLFRAAGLLNITQKRIFTNNDIASLDLIVGDNLRYNFNYYIDKGFYWSVGINSRFSFFDKNVPISFIAKELLDEENSNLNQIELQYNDLTNQVYLETIFRRSFLLGGGLEHKFLRYLSNTIGIDENDNPRTIFESTNYFSTYGFLKYDTFDNTFFPSSGIYFDADFHLYLFADGRNEDFDQFSIAKAQIEYAQPFTDKLSAIISTEGGFKIGGNTTSSLDFFGGGYGFRKINNLVPLYGYEALSVRGDTYLKSGLMVDYELFRKNHINFAVNIANIGDDLFSSGDWIEEIDYSGFAIGYGLESFLGPVEVKYSFSPERKRSEWYVSAGFRF